MLPLPAAYLKHCQKLAGLGIPLAFQVVPQGAQAGSCCGGLRLVSIQHGGQRLVRHLHEQHLHADRSTMQSMPPECSALQVPGFIVSI